MGRATPWLGRVAALAATAWVVATPVATWWLVGDLSERASGTAPDDLDYAFRPFPLAAGTERTLGRAAIVLALVGAIGWVVASQRDRRLVRWLLAMVPLLTAGIIAGAGWRVMSAGSIGANIGAGFVVLFGGPVVVALLAIAFTVTVQLLRGRIRSV